MATSSPFQRDNVFPAELVDLVIDHNHSDPETLMVCALVSKQWTASSRYHAFSKVSISHDNAREFIQLLSSPYCTIARSIRAMDVRFVSGSQRWFTEFIRRLNHPGNVDITSLGILGSRNTTIREEVQTTLLAPTSTSTAQVTHLDVGTVVFEAFSNFAKIVCGFQVLESLSCACAFQVLDGPSDATRFHAPLRRLSLVTPSIRPVFGFLLEQGVLPTVTFLSLSYPNAEDYPNLTRFLETPNNCLHYLSIKVESTISGVPLDTFRERLKLTELRALRSLTIETSPLLSPEQAFRLLTQITSKQLTTLEISMALQQGAGRIDMLLNGDDFPSLRRLRILESNWSDARQFLPRCAANNILQEI